MSFKLIVFDWDGTLMDSEARIVACIQAAFSDVGAQPPTLDASRNIIGLGLHEAMESLWPESSDEQRNGVVDAYRRHFLGANETPSPLFPGAREVVDWLADRGYLLAVATGKSRRGLDSVLASTGLTDRFHATRCADETFSKPHPEMLLQLMDELGVRGTDTLMVGDTEYDMEMARSAGASALAVCYGVHERERLLKYRPLECLATLSKMPDWLERGVAV
ncbi:MAG: HAD-IA family hydrolase [Pseudomonadota bacterium]|nr:HAD-IA family hydrolase [Pseudomonadota bacterium]